jgi:hypothetical protein
MTDARLFGRDVGSKRQEGNGRSVDAFRAAPAQRLAQRRQEDRSMAGEPKDQVRLAGNCNDGEQTATVCGVGLSAVVDLFLGGTVVVMPMRRAVGMHMNPAVIVRRRGAMIVCGGRGVIVRRRAVIMHGGGAVAFNQAMGDARII